MVRTTLCCFCSLVYFGTPSGTVIQLDFRRMKLTILLQIITVKIEVIAHEIFDVRCYTSSVMDLKLPIVRCSFSLILSNTLDQVFVVT